MSAITIDGIEYIHVKEAAKSVDLVSDYVARLCRTGKVRGIKMDRSWYVNDTSLKNFLIAQAYQNELRLQNVAQIAPRGVPTCPPDRLSRI